MRFITVFESTYEATFEPGYDKYINACKGPGELEIGNLIGTTFGWKENKEPFKIHNTLEIEAFPMDKWLEFKKRLTEALPDYDAVSRIRIINALADLESFQPKQLK